MKKPVLLCLFLLLLNIIFILMIHFIVKENRETMERIAPTTEESRHKNEQRGALRLTKEEVKELSTKLNTQIAQLIRLNRTLKISAVFIFLILCWSISKLRWVVARFDGLTLFAITFLLFNLHWLLHFFSSQFAEGNNATVYFRIYISVGVLIAQPILFYISYRWNKIEVLNKLHKQNWISIAAIIFTVVSALAVLIIGVGVLFTPDLSGNIT